MPGGVEAPSWLPDMAARIIPAGGQGDGGGGLLVGGLAGDAVHDGGRDSRDHPADDGGCGSYRAGGPAAAGKAG